jgi:hypothetical protein
MEPEHQYSGVENNKDSVTDNVDIVERNVTSLLTLFIYENNDAKAIVTENNPDCERIIKR